MAKGMIWLEYVGKFEPLQEIETGNMKHELASDEYDKRTKLVHPRRLQATTPDNKKLEHYFPLVNLEGPNCYINFEGD